ncbi:spidroin-1-like [Cavia porcellus]|uniref:spidroin-1-like n=1 Tax=Cavia porcellus TaxID=10141 RepID=UPI002FE07D36
MGLECHKGGAGRGGEAPCRTARTRWPVKLRPGSSGSVLPHPWFLSLEGELRGVPVSSPSPLRFQPPEGPRGAARAVVPPWPGQDASGRRRKRGPARGGQGAKAGRRRQLSATRPGGGVAKQRGRADVAGAPASSAARGACCVRAADVGAAGERGTAARGGGGDLPSRPRSERLGRGAARSSSSSAPPPARGATHNAPEAEAAPRSSGDGHRRGLASPPCRRRRRQRRPRRRRWWRRAVRVRRASGRAGAGGRGAGVRENPVLRRGRAPRMRVCGAEAHCRRARC